MSERKRHKPAKRLEIYNLRGEVKSTKTAVVLEIFPDKGTILELHFSDPTELMNFFWLGIEEMAKVWPDFEMSKLWLDETFK